MTPDVERVLDEMRAWADSEWPTAVRIGDWESRLRALLASSESGQPELCEICQAPNCGCAHQREKLLKAARLKSPTQTVEPSKKSLTTKLTPRCLRSKRAPGTEKEP